MNAWREDGGRTKADLRRWARTRREAMPLAEVLGLSERVYARLAAVSDWEYARIVFTYVSFGKEVQTHPLIGQLLGRGTKVAVPRIVGLGRMEAHCIRSFDELVPGRYGILTPKTISALEESPDLCITPGLAFTPRGGRLGSGGGYYDHYLSQHPQVLAIGLCFESQLLGELPGAAHDRPVDVLVTESRLIRCADSPNHGP